MFLSLRPDPPPVVDDSDSSSGTIGGSTDPVEYKVNTLDKRLSRRDHLKQQQQQQQPIPVDDSSSSSTSSSSTGLPPPFITCNKGYKPVAHNFPLPNGDMVPIGEELQAVDLPQDILWEHLDLSTAPYLKNKDTNERWWTKPITLQDAEDLFEGYFDKPEIKGPEGSLSIVRNLNERHFEAKASGICESFDPRGHRRYDCFYNYIVRWRMQRPFSGMHFFDWLDYGAGRSLFERNRMYNFLPNLGDYNQRTDRECLKEKFNRRNIHFFNDTERDNWEVYLSPSEDGQEVIARYKKSNKVVGEIYNEDSSADESERYGDLYMFDLDKRFYVIDKDLWDDEKYGTIKHTAVTAGGPALSAGKVYFNKDGVMTRINFSSGHYRPDMKAVAMLYQWVKDQGLNTMSFNWVGRLKWSTENCYKTDWKSMEIGGFDTKVLEKSCEEVTKSPRWLGEDY